MLDISANSYQELLKCQNLYQVSGSVQFNSGDDYKYHIHEFF